MGEETLMDDLAAAWDASEETEDAEVQQPEVTEEPGAVDDTVGGREEIPDGGDVPEPVQSDTAAPEAAQEVKDDPPVGLSPAAREAWSEVPDAVKAELRKREEDYEKGIVKYADNAKRAEQMDQVLQPFNQLLAMNGGPGSM